MKKASIFIAIIIIGVITTILEFAVFKFNGTIGFALTYAGLLMILGGTIGSCFFSAKARKFFHGVLEMLLQFI